MFTVLLRTTVVTRMASLEVPGVTRYWMIFVGNTVTSRCAIMSGLKVNTFISHLEMANCYLFIY